MTTMSAPPESSQALVATQTAALAPQGATPRSERQRRTLTPRVAIASTALLILGGMLLGLAFALLLVSPLRHDRDQHVAYAQLRTELANAIAPTNVTDGNGGLLALGAPVAWIDAPDLGIDEVVFNGTTSSVLMSGPGHQRDTAMPGQVGHSIIMGRASAYGGPFGNLAVAPVGTKFQITTGQGTFAYEVTAVRADGEKPAALQPGEGRLTFVTAGGAPYLASGLVQLDATLISDPVAATAGVLPSIMLEQGESAMVGDPSAATGLLLWSALLLGAAVLTVWLSVRWGRWQTWIVAIPVLTAIGVAVANHVVMLLPNLL